MDYDASGKKRLEALRRARMEMCKTLDSHGPAATLNLLVSLSNQDAIVDDLLRLFPSIVATGGFLCKLSVQEIEDDEEGEDE